jgi:hypothetical protein
MTVKNDFNELIRKWIETTKSFPVVKAELDDYMTASDYGGCPTCGPDIEKQFDIWYWIPNDSTSHLMTVDRDPLSWLAYTLLPFADEAGL